MEQLHLRETCWRAVDGPSGRLVICAIYETPRAGLELRVSYVTEETIRSEHVADPESARTRAEQWLDLFRAAGSIASFNEAQRAAGPASDAIVE